MIHYSPYSTESHLLTQYLTWAQHSIVLAKMDD